MSGFKAYQLYCGMKAHFNGKSDMGVHDFHMKNVTEKTYEKRSDKFHFERLSKNHPTDIKDYLIANFSINPDVWVGDLLEQRAEERYKEWQRTTQSMTYKVAREVAKIEDSELSAPEYSHPKALQKYLGGEISLEALMVLLDVSNVKKIWDRKMSDDIVWSELSNRLDRYREVLQYDKAKISAEIRKLVLDKCA
jgi:hypothetical protein